MGKSPCIPIEFKVRPFSLDEARDAGLTLRALRGKSWQRIGAGLYRWKEMPEDHWLTLSAWRRVLPPEAVFAGASAAWLHGIDLDPTNPVEVVVPTESGIRNRVGLKVRRSVIPPTELVSVRGLRATALPLTLATLCLQRPPVEALIAIDRAIFLGLITQVALYRYVIEGARGRHGAPRMRSLLELAAPAESPMETRLRWLLIQGGLHRERLVEDDRRQNLLMTGGYQVLRYTAADIYNRPDVVISQVSAALKRTSGAKRTFAIR